MGLPTAMPVFGSLTLEGQDRLLHTEELVRLSLDGGLDGHCPFGDLGQVQQ
jgi:hypothetical protein